MAGGHDWIEAGGAVNRSVPVGTNFDLGNLDLTVETLTATDIDIPFAAGDSSRVGGVRMGDITGLSVAGGSDLLVEDIRAQASIKSESPTGGVGYMAGAGGTVTQATSKATGATLSKVCGAITTAGDALAAAAIVSFVLTNTAIAVTDVLVLNHISGGTVGSYTLNAQCAAGSATINIRNNTAGSLSEALVIQFAVIKAVNV